MDSMASSFKVAKADHMVADLKTGAAGCEFFLLELVPQVTDKLFGNAIEMHHGFQSKVVIAFEDLHGLVFRLELSSYNQSAILDLLILR